MKKLPESFKIAERMESEKIVRKTTFLVSKITPMFKFISNNEVNIYRESTSRKIDEALELALYITRNKKYNYFEVEKLRTLVLSIKLRIDIAFNDDVFIYLKNKKTTTAKTKGAQAYAMLATAFLDYFHYIEKLMDTIILESRKEEARIKAKEILETRTNTDSEPKYNKEELDKFCYGDFNGESDSSDNVESKIQNDELTEAPFDIDSDIPNLADEDLNYKNLERVQHTHNPNLSIDEVMREIDEYERSHKTTQS